MKYDTYRNKILNFDKNIDIDYIDERDSMTEEYDKSILLGRQFGNKFENNKLYAEYGYSDIMDRDID